MTNDSLIEFPCYFPVKIIGVNSQAFIDEVKALTKQHFPEVKASDSIQKESKNSGYLSFTVTVFATSQAMLDAFYSDISKITGVKMVL